MGAGDLATRRQQSGRSRGLQPALADLLTDDKRLARLLAEEKRRRDIPAHRLAFVGIHNLAQTWYCGMQAVLRSRREEMSYFAAALEDRVLYADGLARIAVAPARDADFLSIGVGLGIHNVEVLFPECARPGQPPLRHRPPLRSEAVSLETGADLQFRYAESYPWFQWCFAWEQFTVVGAPNGLTNDFVYEFKSTRSQRYRVAYAAVPRAQADLYAMFFRRARKRIQILYGDTGAIETIDEDADLDLAASTLRQFAGIEAGYLPPPAPIAKCRCCSCVDVCPVSPLRVHPKE